MGRVPCAKRDVLDVAGGPVRLLAVGLALALLPACTGDGGTPRPAPTTTAASPTSTPPAATPTVTPAPDPGPDVTMTVTTRKGGPPRHRWTAQVPELHGLAAPALTRANGLLAAAVDDLTEAYVEDEEATGQATADVTATLSAVDDRYVTVALLVHVYPEGAAHGYSALDTYVFVRATGRRLALAGWFRPAARTAALRAMGGYLRARVPLVVGEPGFETGSAFEPDPGNFADVTPLPEGLEVTFGSYQVAPYAAGLPAVTVPWRVLETYLAVEPPSGERDPAYRDGHRLQGEDLAAVERVLVASPAVGLARGTFRVERVQRAQWFDDQRWALATVVPDDPGARPLVVALREVNGRWRIVDVGEGVAGCTDLPADVRESVALACG